MAKSWYIAITYTGYEQKIERSIRKFIEDGELDSNIVTDVKVPMEDVLVTRKDGKKSTKKEKILPGYIMLKMDLPAGTGWKAPCAKLRSLQGFTGFVGTNPNVRPKPISDEEAKRIFQQSGDIKGEKTVRVSQEYDVGDNVKVIDGPFATFSGVVETVYPDKTKLRINVQIFGRATPVELDFTQVEKI